MKNVVYFLGLLFFVACGSNTIDSVYEKTISEYLLEGRSNDFNFKIVESNEQGTVTVSDSIAYLTDEFRKDKQLIIDRIELAKKMTEDLKSKTKLKSEFEKYDNDITRMNNSIDSIKNLVPDNLNGYDGRNAGDILVKIIRCKYSVQPSGTSPVTETFDFYLSPDGAKCYRKTRAK